MARNPECISAVIERSAQEATTTDGARTAQPDSRAEQAQWSRLQNWCAHRWVDQPVRGWSGPARRIARYSYRIEQADDSQSAAGSP